MKIFTKRSILKVFIAIAVTIVIMALIREALLRWTGIEIPPAGIGAAGGVVGAIVWLLGTKSQKHESNQP